MPKYKHNGYGISILKAFIRIAIKADCQTVHLVSDEGDTSKEIVFYKVLERRNLFFEL